MSARTAQTGARYLASEQQEQPPVERTKSKRIVITGRGGSRLVPATAPLYEMAAAHHGVDPDVFLSFMRERHAALSNGF